MSTQNLMIESISLRSVGGVFFQMMATGLADFFPWLTVRRIGREYHQWNLVFVAALTGFSGWLLEFSWMTWLLPLLLLFSSILFVWGGASRWIGMAAEWVLVACLLGLFIASLMVIPGWQALDQATAAFVLGTSLVALIVGHWYLVARGLSFGFLTTYTALILGSLIFRAVLITSMVVQGPLRPDVFLWTDIFWWIRLLFGFAAPVIFSVMTLGALKYKNNQAATGILYVVVILVLMGELVHFANASFWWVFE